jgi:transposase
LPVATARPIVLTAAERHRLKKAAYGHSTPHRDRLRAQIVLQAARGRGNAAIARDTGAHLDTVRTWRVRFADGGLAALADRRRCGRPRRFTPVQVAEVKALACQLAAVTSTVRRRPRVSVTMLRLRPTIFLPASVPWLVAGMLVAVFTLCASITQADGSALRPSRCRTNSRSRPLSWAKMLSACHLAK